MEDQRTELLKILESADKTSKTIHTLLEDAESYEENKDSVFLLTKKYRKKIVQAMTLMKPTFDEEAEDQELEITETSTEKKLTKINFEFFPHKNSIAISRSLLPLKIPVSVDLNPSEVPQAPKIHKGPFLIEMQSENGPINASYIGEMEEGKPKGYGRMVYDDGDIIEGVFDGFVLEGYGRIIHWSGYYTEGDFKKGLLDGNGFYTNFPHMSGEPTENKFSYQGIFF